MSKLTSLLIISLLSLAILPNITYAIEQNNLDLVDNIKVKTLKNWYRFQAQINKIAQDEESSSSREPLKAIASSVVYRGKVSNTKQDEYIFQVATPGVVNIHSVSDNPQLDYQLVSTDSSNFYIDGDTLPAGTYTLTIFGDSDSLIDYDYLINGISFAEQPDTTLPKLTFTNPKFPISKTTTSIDFAGISDVKTYVNNGDMFNHDFSGNFQFSVPLHSGKNFVNFQAMTISGNAIHINLTLNVR